MKLSSTAFADGGKIPGEYSMYGPNKTPTLKIEDVPVNTRSLSLIMDDPDAPKGTFTHWLLFNVDPQAGTVGEVIPGNARQGKNDYGKNEYGGPKPPSGEHRYFFKLYALDSTLSLENGAARADLEAAMKDHVLGNAILMGRYAH